MTEGESFYLILVLLYLSECLTFSGVGHQAFISSWGRVSKWRSRPSFLTLSGFRKVVFFGPILPWPKVIITPRAYGAKTSFSSHTFSHFRRRVRFLLLATKRLRLLGLGIFLFYFLLIPLTYYLLRGSPIVIAAIMMGYLLCVVTAGHFFHLHRRIFPSDRLDRYKHSLFTALFPWHAMRAADIIFQQYSSSLSSLIVLASSPEISVNHRSLARLWRMSLHSPSPPITKHQLQHLFTSAGIDPNTLEIQLPHRHCPVCEAEYENSQTHCQECLGVALRNGL